MADYTLDQQKAIAIATATAKVGGDKPQNPYVDPFDPNIVGRDPFTPFGTTKQGDVEIAWPQVAVDMYKSAMLPGRALAGEQIDPVEITDMALNVGIPALRTVGQTGVKGIPKALTKKQISQAPSSEDLGKQAGELFKKTKGAAKSSADSYVDLLSKIERDLFEEGFDPDVHPKVASVFNAISKRLGKEMGGQDVMTVRRIVQNAAGSVVPDERRLGMRMMNKIDDWFDGIDDTASAAAQEARKIWSKAKKVETIDKIFNDATLAASGFENGLRQGFRSLLKNDKKMRGFTKIEKDAMKEVVEGKLTSNIMKKLGKIGPGVGQQSNMLGSGLASAGAYSAFGPLGMAGVQATGYGAQRLGGKATRMAADKARALAAGVRPEMTQQTYGKLEPLLGRVGIGQVPGLLEE